MKTELSPADTGQMLTQQTLPVGNGLSHFSAQLKLVEIRASFDQNAQY